MNSNWSYSPETPNLGKKKTIFFSRVTFCIILSSYVNSIWSYSLETAKLDFDPCDLDLSPQTMTFCMDITFVNGNNSWKFHDDMMTQTLWKRCNRRTDRKIAIQMDGWMDVQTDRSVLRVAWSQLKIYLQVGKLYESKKMNASTMTIFQEVSKYLG